MANIKKILAKHPWFDLSGWEVLEVTEDNDEDFASIMDKMKKEFWHRWASDDEQRAAILYRPEKILHEWVDNMRGGYKEDIARPGGSILL